MDNETVKTTVFAAILTAVVSVVSWLVKLVFGTRDKVLLLEARTVSQEEKIKTLESKLTETRDDLEEKIDGNEKGKLTIECVREVLNEAIDRRDKQAETRRLEWDKTQILQIKTTVQEELQKVFPRHPHGPSGGS